MKYHLLLLFCTCICASLFAQTPKYHITEKTIVRDSGGMVYPYNIWKILTMQGDYVIEPIDPEDKRTDFLLVKLSAEQKNQRLEAMEKPRESDYFRTGKMFGSFRTWDINRRQVNLKEEKGKIIVINFWFINCPPCRMEIPALNELVDSYKNNDSVMFIGIALDRKYDLVEFLQRIPFKYKIIDSGRDLALRYGVQSFPTHVIIDQEGKVYFHTTGLALNTVYWLKKSIAELLDHSALASH